MDHRTMNNDVQQAIANGADTVERIKDKAQELASTAAAKSSGATRRIGEQIETLANRVREKAPAKGTLGTIAAAVADKIQSTGTYLQEKSFDDTIEDLTALVRRHPMQSLLLGIGLGYLLSRNINR